jgi:hypothetical protein
LTEGPKLTDEQARRLWERAAQLQAEAARREEEREAREGDASKALEAGSHRDASASDEPGGYSLVHVREAAQEVGIRSEFVDLALAEDALLELEGGAAERSFDRAAERFLADRREALEVRKQYAFSARPVWLALERALADERQAVELLEVKGGDPWAGGVAIFESPYSYQKTGTLAYYAAVAEVRRFLVRVVPADAGDGSEVLIHAPLRRSRRVNYAVGGVLTGGAGFLGGLAGIGITGAIVGTGGIAALPLGALLGGLTLGMGAGAGVLTRSGYTRLYRWGSTLLERALRKVLTKVELDLERDQALRLPPSE